MPTCKHKPIRNIPVRKGKRTLKILSLYPLTCWDASAPPDLFRVMDGERWVPGEFTADGVARLVASALLESLGHKERDDAPPDIAKGSRVRVLNGSRDSEGRPLYDKTFAVAGPVKRIDGRWVVPVIRIGGGEQYVPCDDLGGSA